MSTIKRRLKNSACANKLLNWHSQFVLCESVANAGHSWYNSDAKVLCIPLHPSTQFTFSHHWPLLFSFLWSMSICSELFSVKSLPPHLLILVLESALFLSPSFELLHESEINCACVSVWIKGLWWDPGETSNVEFLLFVFLYFPRFIICFMVN